MKQYLYVMLSHTNTRMGRFIRFFTREEYNHVSLCLDEGMQQFVSFARYHQDVPLAGGYVSEPVSRLLSCGGTMPVRIFKIEISPTDAQKLEVLFEQADKAPLIYNSLGALLTVCHTRCPIPGAYTCLEFAGAILGTPFSSISALAETLDSWEIYQGDLFDLLKDTGNQDSTFFHKQGFLKSTWDTAVHFRKLLWRILRLERPYDPIANCTLDILLKNIPQSSV